MPNRIIRDWTHSEKINNISFQAEVFFTRLIMKADDFGSFHGNIKILKANLFPLRVDTVRDADISRWIAECEKAGLLLVYTNAAKSYLRILDFGQRLRAMKNKFPEPDSNPPSCDSEPPPSAATCPPEEETEVEEEVETETEKKRKRHSPPFDKKLILENPFSKKFLETWIIWKEYKKKEHRFLFKSIESEQAAMNELVNLSDGNEENAIQIIHQSLAKGWKGFFKIKDNGATKAGTLRDRVNAEFKNRFGANGQAGNKPGS